MYNKVRPFHIPDSAGIVETSAASVYSDIEQV